MIEKVSIKPSTVPKDATVNEQRAEVTAINARSIAGLIDSIRDEDEAAIRLDEMLILRYLGSDGRRRTMVHKLSVPEMQILEKHRAMLDNPASAIQNLALLMYGDGEEAIGQLQ